jgi:type I restriction enzyme S subunit
LNAEELGAFLILLPPEHEQSYIADFLDRETTKIDARIAKKERLVELLQEKRTALITQAVTKGLDPSVPMKDSGIEWLGQIPAHWQVHRIAMAVDKITNGYVGPTRDILVNDGVRYLQSLHIKDGNIDFERKPYHVTVAWSREHKKSELIEGDVLVVQTGDIGQVAVVPKFFVGSNCHALIILQIKRHLGVGRFLARALQSHYGLNALLWSHTGALHPHLECGHVREIKIALPPKLEQELILAELDKRLSSFDEMDYKIKEVIERLKEYRTALISAAVTGKIDVREN